MTEKRKVGRPPKPESEKAGPRRMFGCVKESPWNELKSAAVREGQSFTAWALEVLLREAQSSKKLKKK